MNTKIFGFLVAVVVAIPLTLVACLAGHDAPATSPELPVAALVPSSTSAAPATITATSIWSGLLQKTPYPYSTPLPLAEPTILDGIYTKFNPIQSGRVPLPEGGVSMPHPRREGVFWVKPVPYPLEGGVWVLQLDKGVFRVFHETTGWRTLGSFTVSEDRIEFFNDPHCYNAVGSYTWKLEAKQLTLTAIEDECDGRVLGGGGLRVMNFESHPWLLLNSYRDE